MDLLLGPVDQLPPGELLGPLHRETMDELLSDIDPVPLPSSDDCSSNKWHVITLPGVEYTCTNDKVYPEVAWGDKLGDSLFDTAQDCCDYSFP